MKTRNCILLFGVLILFASGCAKRVALESGVRYNSCGIEAVFAQSTTSYAEGVKPEDPLWVVVDVKISDPDFDFGYLNEVGNFIHVFSGQEGSFEVGGGRRIYLALRESAGQRTVYDAQEHGSCSFSGSKLEAGQALLPKLDHPYFSSVSVIFDLPGGREITATLSTSAPNGFSIITD